MKALPHATYLGFTGTPVESTDANTAQVFGDYVDVYDIAQAVEDGATVKIYYESRLAKIRLSEEGQELVKALDDELAQEDLTENQKSMAKWTQLEALIGAEDRIKRVAADIVEHFGLRQEVNNGGKGMVVAMSRRIAVDLFEAIVALRPDWHDDDLAKGKIKIVMTAASRVKSSEGMSRPAKSRSFSALTFALRASAASDRSALSSSATMRGVSPRLARRLSSASSPVSA
jgi:type I restriction enzyme R subunit